MKYKQLPLKERYHISTLLERGYKQKEIAEHIGVHPSTISREIRRNKYKELVIYRYQSYSWTRHKNKKYHKRANEHKQRGTIIDRVMIDKHSKIVEKKKRIGDLEIDTVIGKDHIGSLVTVVDRRSKFTLIRQVPSNVTHALIEILKPIKPVHKTITSDNGKE